MRPDDAVTIDPIDIDVMFKLLSLDVTRKLYSIIGLAIDDDGGLVDAIRDALEVEQPVYSPQSSVDRVFATIRERLGSATVEVVRFWAATNFYHAYRAKHIYGYWTVLLAHCRWQPALWEGLSLPDARRESFMAHFLSAQDEDGFETAYETAAGALLSDWDLSMRVTDPFHDADSGVDGTEVLLRSLASLERNRRFWQWVVRTLTAAEVDELHASANALVKGTPEFAFIDDDLRHPAALAFPGGQRG